ncbi:MAG: metalloregulator ArsR/SmtB family transcription factor [Boseongicola sp.]|nr:MAG: metalloregulator ArsR/SmtB family transcription factor [Boseongicola sp.]
MAYHYETSILMAALGDPTRRSIVECLGKSPSNVRHIADRLPVTRPAVSQHLKVLLNSGIVTFEPVGTQRVYRLEPAAIAALRDWCDKL